MKTIQITMDENLLEQLDQDQETQRDGRSAVLRRAIAEYLERRRRQDIAERYRKAYSKKPGLGRDFEGWEDEGQWPNE
jgi:metal-responsive CopG/Arc/MetJ family transcriptional regulator